MPNATDDQSVHTTPYAPDSYEVTQNAKGDLQLKLKLYFDATKTSEISRVEALSSALFERFNAAHRSK